MRTLTTPAPGPASARRTLTRISALGVACAAALALAACSSGGGSSKKGTSSTSSAAGSFPGAQSSSSASALPSFDPAAGPTMAAPQLPKNCDGLVTDADMQLALGSPLNGGDVFTAFKPTAANQLGKVLCQYGVVQDNTGKVTGDQVDVQLAIYADAATAQSHGANTVGQFAGGGAQYAPISVGGHPATYITEAGKDAVLVMYDGNRTFLITTQEALVKGDDAKAFTLKIAAALYKHTTPTPAPSSSAPAPGPNSTPGAPPPGAPSSSAPAGQPSPPAGQPSAPAGQPSAPAVPSTPPKSAPAD